MRPCPILKPFILLTLTAALLGGAAARAGTWNRIGPEGGTMTCLVSVPGRPATLYAGFLDGGIFRSDDRGASWQYAGSGSGRLTVEALATDARNPETLYAVSGSAGVVKTVDGGRSWAPVTRGLPALAPLAVIAVAADGKVSGTAYAALRQGGLYKTVDGGKRWTALPGSSPRDVRLLVADPRAGGTVYALTSSNRLFKSANSGNRWRSIRRGLEGYGTILSLYADPRNPQTLYVLAANSQQVRLFKSADGGAKWSQVGTPGNVELYSFALDPAEPSTLYLGALDGILRSRDGGRSWQFTPGAPEGTQLHVWGAAATVIAQPYSRGFFRSGDRGDHWAPATGIRSLPSHNLAAAPGRLYTLSLGLVEQRSDDEGRTWAPLSPLADQSFRRFGEVFVIDPGTPSTIYAGFGETLARSTDGGDRWEVFPTPGCLRPRVLTLDPSNPENFYVAGDIPQSCPFGPDACGVYRKLGAGAWECIKGELPGTGLPIAAVDPFTPSNLYTFFPDVILRSTDHGLHWSFLARIDFLSAMVPDPTRQGVLYAGYLGGTARSYDGGETWDLSSAGIPQDQFISQLVPHPTAGATLYAATPGEVYRSDDEGRTWRRAGTGLGETVVHQIALDPVDPSIVYAATSGGGVLRLEQE